MNEVVGELMKWKQEAASGHNDGWAQKGYRDKLKEVEDYLYDGGSVCHKNELCVDGEYKYWIKASPLARLNPEEWLVSIFKKGKVSWVTESTKDGFTTPEEAYEWALEEIKKWK